MSDYPNDRYYSEEHEWVQADGDEVVIGITNFAQDELGDVVFVELPEVGREVEANEEMGTIESVKAVAELFSPLGGTITGVNSKVEEAPELLNDSPHEEGWLIRMTPEDPQAVEALMDAATYEDYVQSS